MRDAARRLHTHRLQVPANVVEHPDWEHYDVGRLEGPRVARPSHKLGDTKVAQRAREIGHRIKGDGYQRVPDDEFEEELQDLDDIDVGEEPPPAGPRSPGY
jgi:hypothetical protein